MPRNKITQQDEAKALNNVLSKSLFEKEFSATQYISLSQFFDEAPISIEYKAEVIEDVLSSLIFGHEFDDDNEFEFSSFNDFKTYVLELSTKYSACSYEGISLKAQQVKTILSDIGSFEEKESILMSSILFGILDKEESTQAFKKLISDESTLEEKYDLAMNSLYSNFDLLAKDEYESLMATYDHSLAYEYAGLLLTSAACPRTKDWVKKEYFSNILEDVNSTEWLADEMPLLQEAQNDLFGE